MKQILIVVSFGVLLVSTLAAPVQGQTSEQDPIVIIPGIMASFNLDILLESDFEETEVREERDEWRFTPGIKQYEQLIQALRDEGLVEGEDFFIAFYDWRQSNSNSVQNYLIPILDQALSHSSTGKVDIVAHSMGGLVARSYIQGNSYRNDVDQLIMLGTPNHGSSDVYTLWEGGSIPTNWDRGQQRVLAGYMWYMRNIGEVADNYDVIHQFVPSTKEMLPTYDYLVDQETGELKEYHLMQETNGFLADLNNKNPGEFYNRVPGGITTFAGTGVETVGGITVVPHAEADGKLWADGKPEPLTPPRNASEGDNRVLITSAHLDDSPPVVTQAETSWWHKLLQPFTEQVQAGFLFNDVTIESGHGALPTNAIGQVFDILAIGEPNGTYDVIPDPEEILSFWFASPVSVKITDPHGKTITKDTNTIPGATYDGQEDPLGFKEVVIENPVPGTYTVELVGLADGNYHFATAFFEEGSETIETVEKSITANEKVGYTVNFGTALDPVQVSDPFVPQEAPPPTPLALTTDLINYIDNLKSEGALPPTAHAELRAHLLSAQNSLKQVDLLLASNHPQKERNAATLRRFALISLNSFTGAVERRKIQIGILLADELKARAQKIKSLLGDLGPLRPPPVSPITYYLKKDLLSKEVFLLF